MEVVVYGFNKDEAIALIREASDTLREGSTERE